MNGSVETNGPRLEEDQLLAAAQAATGLHDWGTDPTFRIGLGKLIASLNEMRASAALLEQARGRMIASLVTKLRFVEDERRHPEILAEKIERPVVIIGLPRTGTTVLYDLLALDPATRTPRDWEFAMPWPAPEAATWTSDPRIAQMNAIFSQLLAAAPTLADIQTFEATHPSECNLAFTHHFASTQFPAEWGVPSYARWLRDTKPPGRYAAHRRILQQLQWKGPRGRWTLKSPEHLCTVEELMQAYPDACLIWTHRDPVSAFSSLSSMLSEFLKAVGAKEDRQAVGRYVVDMWSTALEHATTARARSPKIEQAVIDIAHREVIQDKFAVVRQIHRRFGLPFTHEHEMRLKAEADKVSARLGRHKHRPEDFGISEEEVRERLPKYLARFGRLFGRH
jgi:hypothetical protein